MEWHVGACLRENTASQTISSGYRPLTILSEDGKNSIPPTAAASHLSVMTN